MFKTFPCKALVALLGAGLISACSTSRPLDPITKDPGIYRVSFRQLPPEPTYRRQGWVLPPDVLPEKNLPLGEPPTYDPVFHLKISNTPVSEVAQLLADASRFSSSCDGSKCARKVSMNMLGTVSELALKAGSLAGVVFVVDHDARQIRVDSESLHSEAD